MANVTKSSLLYTDSSLGSGTGVIDDQGVTGQSASGSLTALGSAPAGTFLVAFASDAADGLYFVSTGTGTNYQIYQEHYGQVPSFTTANKVLPSPIPIVSGQSTQINQIALDTANHILYYTSNASFYEVKYGSSFANAPAAPTLLATLPTAINSFAVDLADHTAYFTAQNITESLGFSGSSTETIQGNYIYKLSGVTPIATSATLSATYNVPYAGSSNPGLVGGIAVDSANDTVYFTTAVPAVSSADPGAKAGIYSLPASFTSSTPLTTVAQTGLTFPIFTPGSIAIDPVTGTYYFAVENSSGNQAIYTGNVVSNTTTQLLMTPSGTAPFALAIDDPPTVSAGAVTAIDGNTARTTGEVQPGDTVAITVTFNETVTVAGAPKLTLNDGGTASYASGSGTAKLVFTYTVAAGQNTATLAVTGVTTSVTDTIVDLAGTPANTAGAAVTLTGLRVDSTAPTLSLTGAPGDAVQGGGSFTLLATSPTITDASGNGILTGAKVQVTSGLATGDVLGVGGGQTTSLTFGDGTINLAYASGSVTLSGNASVADYASALSQVTLTDGGTHTASNAHPIQNVSWTVTEGTLTSTAQSQQVTVDRAPAVASGGVTKTVVEGATGTGATGAALAGDTDADGDTLSVASVSHGGAGVAAGTAVAGTYGSLTLNANGSYSYAATNTAAINAGPAGAPLTDTFTFQVSDGSTTTPEAFTATVLRPPVLTTDNGATSYPAMQPAVAVDPGITLTDADTTTVASASVTITAGLATGDLLALGNTEGGLLTGGYSNGVLTITGPATVAQYQTALASVTYASTASDPAAGHDPARTVSFFVTDSLGVFSNTATKTVAESPACYCLGTLIAVEDGERAVEELRIGDRVRTAEGPLRPVRWIGRRSYAGRFLLANPSARPICFAAGSLGDGLPRRALCVSPNHSMMIDRLLIPARHLVNGTTIAVEPSHSRVDYFHVELDQHDILLAEGAPSESFLDDGSRGLFHNAAEFAALYPDAPRPDGQCAPRLESGQALEKIRRPLGGACKAFRLRRNLAGLASWGMISGVKRTAPNHQVYSVHQMIGVP